MSLVTVKPDDDVRFEVPDEKRAHTIHASRLLPLFEKYEREPLGLAMEIVENQMRKAMQDVVEVHSRITASAPPLGCESWKAIWYLAKASKLTKQLMALAEDFDDSCGTF